MPKSRHRRKKPSPPRPASPSKVKMSAELHAAMLEQRKAFVAKFGREPGPEDPIFFDPDADVPTPMSPEKMHKDAIDTLRNAGADEAKIAAILRGLK